ncbi:MAG: wax ester/triacylglycerol synthase family O-acyltransferase [Rhodothermaceae bacterium]|nr:wax ester/triacylglycerol synthase family O-acyltransferase [Rhodothermaceae bacterium]
MPPITKKMTAADVAWLRMENPANPMTITGVMMTAKPMDRATLLRLIEERLTVYQRFRMRVDDPKSLAPHWVLEDPFDAERRVIPFTLPAPGDQRALERAVSDLMSTPLSFNEPPWTFHHIERYGEGSAIIIRLHHIIGDGIAMMHVLLSMSDELWDPATISGDRKQPKRPLPARVKRTTKNALGETWDLISDPSHLVARAKQFGGGTKALGGLLAMSPDSDTLFKGKATREKRAAWSKPIALDTIKAIGHATGSKVNDVLLAAASGALGRYLTERSQPTEGVVIRAAVPVNVRPLDRAHELGNAFALVFLPLPIGIRDPVERVRQLKASMDELKQSSQPAVVYGILQSIGVAPKWFHRFVVWLFSQKASAVMTNVPGPQEPLHLLDVPLGDLMFWVPQAGDIGLGLSILSFNGRVLVGVAADTTLVPDPWALVENFEEEFAALATRYAPQPATS